MAEQLRRHFTLSRLFGQLALYVTSSIWSCSNDFNIKLLLFETRIGTLTIAWSGCALLGGCLRKVWQDHGLEQRR